VFQSGYKLLGVAALNLCNPIRLGAVAALAGLAMSAAGCSKAMKNPGPAVTIPPGAGPQLTDADMPHPKPGLWKVHAAVTGDSQTCLSGQTLRYFIPPAVCTQNSRQASADGGVVMDSQCTDGSHTTTHAKGDYQSAFFVEFSGAASLNGRTSTMTDHLDYSYVGPCADGQKPNDVS
jgi:hypothetical protein